VTDLHKADPSLTSAKRFHNAVDTVARQPKDDVHAPIDEAFHQHIRCRQSHFTLRAVCLRKDHARRGSSALQAWHLHVFRERSMRALVHMAPHVITLPIARL
jgi:hypothetical protein